MRTDYECLREATYEVRVARNRSSGPKRIWEKGGSVGRSGDTVKASEMCLEMNLADDRDRLKTLTSRSNMPSLPISPILADPRKPHLVIQIVAMIDLLLDPYMHERPSRSRPLLLLEPIHHARPRSEGNFHLRVYGKTEETGVASTLTKGDPQGWVVRVGGQQRVAALAVRRCKD